MRALHAVLALLYAAAAAVQWNDPDPVRWIAIYAAAAALSAAAAARRPWPRGAALMLAIAVVWAVTLAPDAVDGIRHSAREVFGAMSMHAHHVEEARECLGLLLVAVGLAPIAVKRD